MDATKRTDVPAERKLLLGNPRGFCAGVVRAVAIVRIATARYGSPVYVLNRIVHNDEVVAGLESEGAIFVGDLSEVPDGSLVIFSPHGIPPSVKRETERRGLRYIDSTCPLVAKVHREALRFKSEGRSILLIGQADHPEVIGVVGEAPQHITVIDPRVDLNQLDIEVEGIAVLSQTTLPYGDTTRFVEALRERYNDVVVPTGDDICYATQNRQDAVRALAEHCDTLIVVSGSRSNNGSSLAHVAAQLGCSTHLTPNADGILSDWLGTSGTIGLVAAASTPESSIAGCIGRIRELVPGIVVEEMQGATEEISFRLPPELEDSGAGT